MKKLPLLLSLTALVAAPLALQAKEHCKDHPAKTVASVDLAKVFDNKLVDAEGKRVKSDNLAKADYVAVYFSAHWCPPCRKFTPELVKFTNENRKNGNFEVVFVSSDKDEKAMREYMSVMKMPWGGVLKGGVNLKALGHEVDGIPHLRVFDKTGKVVIDTDYDAEVYPTVVLEKLKALAVK